MHGAFKRGTRAARVALALAAWSAAARADGPPVGDAAVRVTGRDLVLNGVAEVPRGLFGVHATPLTPQRVADWGIEAERRIQYAPAGAPAAAQTPVLLECFYDRYQPATIVTDPATWEASLARLAQAYGEAARQAGRRCAVEFWNEPYLNWGVNPGVNYDGAFYEQADTTPGRRMTLLGRAEPTSHLVWDRPRPVAVDRDGRAHYVATRRLPPGLPAGASFEWAGGTFRVETRPWGRDPGQRTWWAGPQNREFYERMVVPFARALKAANPEVELVVGWGFHIHQNDWAAWEDLHRPLLDLVHPWADGYNEHHYGGDPRLVYAAYETAYAYALGRYGKRFGFYNTEAGGHLDPEQPATGARTRPEGPPLERARGAFTYTFRDLVLALALCPDKARMRFAHEAHLNGGDEVAFRLLRGFRGRLLEVETDPPSVIAAACRKPGGLAVAMFNDADTPADVPLSVRAPPGLVLAGARRLFARASQERWEAAGEPVAAGGDRWLGPIRLGARSGAVLEFAIAGEAAGVPAAAWTQYASGEVLQRVSAGAPARHTVAVEPAACPASAARLRIVHEGIPADLELRIEVNGRVLAAPLRRSSIADLDLDPSWVATSNTVVVAAPGDWAGRGRVCAVGFLLAPPPPAVRR